MNILFYDPATPIAYTDLTLRQHALRGTESTIVRIAHALSRHHQVYIAQHCRSTANNQVSDGVHYISFESARDLSPDIVILLRYHRLLETVARHFPTARHYFWLHNLPSCDLHRYRDVLIKHRYQLIAVSHFHRQVIEKRLNGKWYHRLFQHRDENHPIPVSVLYNPIEDDLNPDDSSVNFNQMIFTSSPYKGLVQTLKLFERISKRFPEYELLIVSPDKLDTKLTLPQQVRFLEPLPPHRLAKPIRESFCVFYPQTQRIETFGLVYAEANAVGTPVLAHDFGAASEVLSHPCQLINGHKPSTLIEKIEEWREQRPKVTAKSEFRLSKVVAAWLAFLEKG